MGVGIAEFVESQAAVSSISTMVCGVTVTEGVMAGCAEKSVVMGGSVVTR